MSNLPNVHTNKIPGIRTCFSSTQTSIAILKYRNLDAGGGAETSN